MNKITFELKEGIQFHVIKTDLFKTDLSYVVLTIPIDKETITMNSLIPLMLKRGSKKYPTQYVINDELENLYGASFGGMVDKSGDNLCIRYFIESINNDYALNGENILQKALDMLFDITFNPLRENGDLKQEFFEVEKNHLRKIIESKIDDKDSYALDRCVSLMYENESYGQYKYGNVEDLEWITIEKLSRQYDWLINNAKIDIFVSTNSNELEIKKVIEENENIQKLSARKPVYVPIDYSLEKEDVEEKIVVEELNVTQGKLVMGLDVNFKSDNYSAIASVYNTILGDGANSMLFQNVREKASLAYTARSSAVKSKFNIYIRCGIQIENFDKALELIRIQLQDMRDGKFSDDMIQDAKVYLNSTFKGIEEEQNTEVVYYIGQELAYQKSTIEEFMNNINKVSREDIISFANSVRINTIYFLKDIVGEE